MFRSSAYNSGLFLVSITAARGIPKFDAGPQKSVQTPCQLSPALHNGARDISRFIGKDARVEQK